MTNSTRKLKSSNVTTRLMALLKVISRFINTASEEEKDALLRLLEDRRLVELLERRRQENRRKHSRKPCSIDVDYATWQGAFNGSVQNISDGGMAIETDKALSMGDEVTVSVFPAQRKESIRVSAEIVWTKPGAVGLKFHSLSKDLKEIIECL